MLRVLKCSDAEPENLSKTSGSKPEVAVKCDIALSIFTYWKNVTSASMKMPALTPSLRKIFQNTLYSITLSWNDEQYWEVIMLPELCMSCSFFVLMNKSPDKNPVFLFQVDRWNARLPWKNFSPGSSQDWFGCSMHKECYMAESVFQETWCFWCFLSQPYFAIILVELLAII